MRTPGGEKPTCALTRKETRSPRPPDLRQVHAELQVPPLQRLQVRISFLSAGTFTSQRRAKIHTGTTSGWLMAVPVTAHIERIFHVTGVWPGTECDMHKAGDEKRGQWVRGRPFPVSQRRSPLLSERRAAPQGAGAQRWGAGASLHEPGGGSPLPARLPAGPPRKLPELLLSGQTCAFSSEKGTPCLSRSESCNSCLPGPRVLVE